MRRFNEEEIKVALVHVFRNSTVMERKVEKIVESHDQDKFLSAHGREEIYSEICKVVRKKSIGTVYEPIKQTESFIDYFVKISDSVRYENSVNLRVRELYDRTWELLRTKSLNLFSDDDFKIIINAYRAAEGVADVLDFSTIEKILTNAEEDRIDRKSRSTIMDEVSVQHLSLNDDFCYDNHDEHHHDFDDCHDGDDRSSVYYININAVMRCDTKQVIFDCDMKGVPIIECETDEGDFLFIQMHFPNGKSVGAIADTTCNLEGVIERDYVRQLGYEEEIKKSEMVTLIMDDGETHRSDECFTIQVMIGEVPHVINFTVCEELKAGALLGQQVLGRVGVLNNLDWAYERFNR